MKEVYIIEITEYNTRSFESNYVHDYAFENKQRAVEKIHELGFMEVGYNSYLKSNGERTFANLKLLKVH